MTGTMKALVLEEIGGVLELRELPRPEAGAGEVLVRIAASGVNPLDTKIRAGAAAHAQMNPPAILGIDLAGTVVEVGPGVEGFALGDEVYGMTGGVGGVQGSLAEFASVDADLLAHKPQSLTMVEAAALPLAVITAWEGLVDRADVGPDDVVLVTGGAGGVGSVGVQIAVARGAKVWATGSASSFDTITELGAQPIDRHTPVADYVAAATDGQGFDVIFDTVGGAAIDAAFGAVRPYTGHVVSILGWGSHSLAPLSFRGASYSGVFTLLPLLTGRGRAHHGETLRAVAALADEGLLTPRLHTTAYGWDSVMDAHAAVEAGGLQGKVVVDLSSN